MIARLFSTGSRPVRAAARRATLAAVAACLLSVFAVSCADKGISPTAVQFNPKIALQVTITANQQVAFGPHFLIAAAGFEGEGQDDGGFLGAKIIPYVPGTHTLTVPVDLAPCLVYFARKGRGACALLVGAAIVPDTLFLSDTTEQGDPFSEAFDYFFAGPFNVGPGGLLPTVPPINLSVSRFGVVTWEGDNALRRGGDDAPVDPTRVQIAGGSYAPLAGAATGTGPPTLFALTYGFDPPATDQQSFNIQFFPQLAIFQNGTWRRVTATTAPPNVQGFNDVTALATNDVYMAHATGLYRYDGSSIARVSQVGDSLFSVASVTANATAKPVIAGTGNGGVWIGNGQSWQRYSLGVNNRIDGVCITGPNEAFASSLIGGGLFRFNGTAWTSVPAPTGGGKFDLQCPAAGQAYVLTGGGLMFSWNGSGWTQMTTSGLGAARRYRWAVASPSEIYVVADSALINRAYYRFNGSSWSEVGRVRYVQLPGRPWARPGGGEAYMLSAFGRMDRVTPSGVSTVSYQPSLREVSMSSLTNAFAVGWNMLLARWDGAKWTVDAPPASLRATTVLQGVWTGGPASAWAVGGFSTVLRYDGGGWVAYADSTKPVGTLDNYNAVWGSGNDMWAAGDATLIKCTVAGPCVAQSGLGNTPLYSIWGSSATDIWAVGLGGKILRYNGSIWNTVTSPTNRTLARVHGSGPSDVWAVGDSVILHFDGSQWQKASTEGDIEQVLSHVPTPTELAGTATSNLQFLFQLGLYVRGPKEVYVGGQYGSISRWDGERWQEMTSVRYRRRVTSISGVPGGCALALTDGQSEPNRTPSLWRGIGPTGCLSTPMPGPTSWP